MDESHESIGMLFPLGGPVPPDLIIGRRGEIDEIGGRLREGMSTMLAGARRIGKTTVCAAVCEQLGSEGVLVIEVDVPERGDSRALLQLIIDACSRITLARRGRSALRLARPAIDKLLSEYGVPLDLSALGREPEERPARAADRALPQGWIATRRGSARRTSEMERWASIRDDGRGSLHRAERP